MSDAKSAAYSQCYVCGSDNSAGLHVQFRPDAAGGSRADYTARPEHAGWPGLIHGGLLFTLMDEAVAWACTYEGTRCVTAKAEARFRAPAKVGMPLVITGRVTFATRRALRATAEIRHGSGAGELIAEMEAMMAIART